MHFLYTYSLGPKNSVKKDRLRQQKEAFQAWKSMVNMRSVTFRAITRVNGPLSGKWKK